MTNCLFVVHGVRDSTLGAWHLSVPYGLHNHGASKSKATHPSLRKLDPANRQELVSLTTANVQPRTIGAVLRERGHGDNFVMKDIYNARQRIHAENLNGRTPIQALVAQMSQDDYLWNVRINPDGHVTHLFFVHRQSL
jgi:hypothetical protein